MLPIMVLSGVVAIGFSFWNSSEQHYRILHNQAMMDARAMASQLHQSQDDARLWAAKLVNVARSANGVQSLMRDARVNAELVEIEVGEAYLIPPNGGEPLSLVASISDTSKALSEVVTRSGDLPLSVGITEVEGVLHHWLVYRFPDLKGVFSANLPRYLENYTLVIRTAADIQEYIACEQGQARVLPAAMFTVTNNATEYSYKTVSEGFVLSTKQFSVEYKVDRGRVHDEVLKVIWRNVLLAVSMIVAFYLMVLAGLRRVVVKPVLALADGVKIADETGSIPSKLLETNDEIGQLGVQFQNLYEHIRETAYIDGVTGLLNRVRFVQLADRLFTRNEDVFYTLYYIDLAHFKYVNDYYGHAEGDALLADFSQRLQSLLTDLYSSHQEYLISRLSGDEFAILVRESDRESAVADVTFGILDMFIGGYDWKQYKLTLSASIGRASYPVHAINAVDLLARGDEAMYHAKRRGKNRAEDFNQSLQDELSNRMYIEDAIKSEIDGGSFEFLYQPIFDASLTHIVGAEVLLRSQHPLLVSKGTEEFIRIAEASTLIQQVDSYVLEHSFATLQTLQKEVDDFRLAINVSTAELMNEQFVDLIKDLLQRYQVPPSWVDIEITETKLVSIDTRTKAIVQSLKKLGVGIVVDDFGTGYTQINHLYDYSVDKVKIDQSFIRAITPESGAAHVVDFVLALAESNDLNVVAEGVNTQFQADYLRERGCDCYQGHALAEPLPLKSLIALLEQDIPFPRLP